MAVRSEPHPLPSRSPACAAKARASNRSVAIKGPDGTLLDTAIPKVAITKDASYWDDDGTPDPEAEVDLVAMIGHMLKSAPLAGFVVEGFTPYGRSASNARHG